MTIGIGAFGPNAGRAVFDALRAAERIGTGAIGGFVTFAAIAEDSEVLRAETQRGGSSTLFVEGETTGVEPPERLARARIAGLISSGPDRPSPLSIYLLADPSAGLVSGHRIPRAESGAARAMNEEVMDLLRAGQAAAEAIDAVIGANPSADVGLIAIDKAGRAHARNTERVSRRPDLGHARREDAASKAVVEVLHNAIRPFPVVAEVAAAYAIARMVGEPAPVGWVTIDAGVPIVLGSESAVECDASGRAIRVVSTDPTIVRDAAVGAGIYLASLVTIAGKPVGRTMFEPIATIRDKRIVDLSGQKSLRMSYR
ncbi:MAG: hypothetical protein FJX56_03785 [Alphaproteobacteria bacterium]|nr:hypothetical protein [Alphaproteobacteria bacterium]